LGLATIGASAALGQEQAQVVHQRAKNVIFFLGDGMGVSTVTATRVYSVGVDGNLVLDYFPNVALSRTATTDHITPDSAGTMSAMMTGVNTNSGVIGFAPTAERADFNKDGDGLPLWTLGELAKRQGLKVGVVTTARVTHATPAAVYAHVNDRDLENNIALQALPGDAAYNTRLGSGLDILMGGGRRFFVPSGVADEEGSNGSRPDGRDLRLEYQAAGYKYVYNQTGFDALTHNDLPVLGLFESSHVEYEYDRPSDLGGEPSLSEMTWKSVDMLEKVTKDSGQGYFLMVESGRIDHAHHDGNAWRNIIDTQEFDRAIGAAIQRVDLRKTLIVVTADHSHVFTIAGYPMRARSELPYVPKSADPAYLASPYNNILDVVFDISTSGDISVRKAQDGAPYTVLSYANGGGYRGPGPRPNPQTDGTPGFRGVVPTPVGGSNSNHPAYLQEATVPLGLGGETHSGEDVAFYGVGPNSGKIRGTMRNWQIFHIVRGALGL
jgi:alkaline phosphatase